MNSTTNSIPMKKNWMKKKTDWISYFYDNIIVQKKRKKNPIESGHLPSTLRSISKLSIDIFLHLRVLLGAAHNAQRMQRPFGPFVAPRATIDKQLRPRYLMRRKSSWSMFLCYVMMMMIISLRNHLKLYAQQHRILPTLLAVFDEIDGLHRFLGDHCHRVAFFRCSKKKKKTRENDRYRWLLLVR